MGSLETRISILNDFDAYPAGRNEEDGPNSGEKFREEILYPKYVEALVKDWPLVVNFDGVQSFGSSFLQESFGGLVSKKGVNKHDLLRRLDLRGDNPGYARYFRAIERYIKDAKA